MSISDDFRIEAYRGMVVYPLKITQEELEFVEFVLQLYNVAEDTVPSFFDLLLRRIKKLQKEMNIGLEDLLNKASKEESS